MAEAGYNCIRLEAASKAIVGRSHGLVVILQGAQQHLDYGIRVVNAFLSFDGHFRAQRILTWTALQQLVKTYKP